MERKDTSRDIVNSSIVVATLVGKFQELLARAVECALQTPDNFFNVVSFEKVLHHLITTIAILSAPLSS